MSRHRTALSPCERSIPHTRVEDERQIEESYVIGEVLGKGSFGVVREALQKKTGQKFAIKVIHKEKVRPSCGIRICLGVECLFVSSNEVFLTYRVDFFVMS